MFREACGTGHVRRKLCAGRARASGRRRAARVVRAVRALVAQNLLLAVGDVVRRGAVAGQDVEQLVREGEPEETGRAVGARAAQLDRRDRRSSLLAARVRVGWTSNTTCIFWGTTIWRRLGQFQKALPAL